MMQKCLGVWSIGAKTEHWQMLSSETRSLCDECHVQKHWMEDHKTEDIWIRWWQIRWTKSGWSWFVMPKGPKSPKDSEQTWSKAQKMPGINPKSRQRYRFWYRTWLDTQGSNNGAFSSAPRVSTKPYWVYADISVESSLLWGCGRPKSCNSCCHGMLSQTCWLH